MGDQDITPVERARLAAIDRLTAQDLTEYERYCQGNKPNLSPDVNKRLYELYLNGMSVDDMQALNPGLPRGAILKARVDGRWDERRDVYLGEILADVPGRMKQLAAESLGFMSLMLAVAHKEQGEALKLYLQTGDAKHLGDFRIKSFGQYKQVIEAISRLLEAGKGKGGENAAPLVNVVAQPGSNVSLSPGTEGTESKRMTPAQADAIRAALERKG